jgi:hypothetical protein
MNYAIEISGGYGCTDRHGMQFNIRDTDSPTTPADVNVAIDAAVNARRNRPASTASLPVSRSPMAAVALAPRRRGTDRMPPVYLLKKGPLVEAVPADKSFPFPGGCSH